MKYILLIHPGDTPTPRDPEARTSRGRCSPTTRRRFLERKLAEL
jgi:hypothetical protein